MGKLLLMSFGVIMFAACRQQQPATTPPTGGLRKISVADSQAVERIRQSGAKILVQQPDYIVAYLDSVPADQVTALAAESNPAGEQDLVQRLVRIHYADKAQLQQIIDLGVDVWEVQSDSVTARVYDLHLEQLQQSGFVYRIIKMDASAQEDK